MSPTEDFRSSHAIRQDLERPVDRAAPGPIKWAICVFSAGLFLYSTTAKAGTAEAAATAPGKWDAGVGNNAGRSLTIDTFAGINSIGASQLTNTWSSPVLGLLPAVNPFGTFGTGVFNLTRFGPGMWTVTAPKPAGGAGASLSTNYVLGRTQEAFASGRQSPVGNPLNADAFTIAAAGAAVRAGAKTIDPVPILTGSYMYAATIGGMSITTVDTMGGTSQEPASLTVDKPGEVATMEYFADDSNDPTYLTTLSKPIWDFAITLDAIGTTPVLSASFEEDPSRFSIPGGPTSPSQYQSYANMLLSTLLSDTSDVSLTGVGSLGETFKIFNPVTLFTATYTAAISGPGAPDPNVPNAIDFEYGVGAGVSVVPEPATWALMLFGFGAAGAGLRHRRRPALNRIGRRGAPNLG